MKTRYAIIEPGPMIPEQLIALQGSPIIELGWVDCEFKKEKSRSNIGDAEIIPLAEFHRVLDPLFPSTDWERVQVNSFKGPSDMFVDEYGAMAAKGGPLPVNDAATSIYWTASIMHELAKGERGTRDHAEFAKRALALAADRLKIDHRTPRIHGRAVLFEDRVWF